MTAKKASGARVLERKVWARVLEDGIFETYLAILMLNAVVWMAAGQLGLAYADTIVPPFVVLMIAAGIYPKAKERITGPRMGHFTLERSRTSKARLAAGLSVGITVLLVLFTMLAVYGAFSDGVPTELIIFGAFATQVVAMFCVGAYYTGVQRFYVYGALAAIGMAAAEVAVATQGLERGWDIVGLLGLPAIVMLPTGIVLLVRFVRRYPVTEA